MKIYSDTLTYADLSEATPRGVWLYSCEPLKRPRKRRNGWTVSLEGTSPYRSQFGGGENHQAATWDEHGLWMAELYRRDPEAVIAYYKTHADFIQATTEARDYPNQPEVRDYYAEGTAAGTKWRKTHRAPWLTA